MTDPSRFQAHWKTPFLFSPHDKASNDLQQYLTSSLASDNSFSVRSLPASPHHHSLRQANSCVSFQPFDPFDTDAALDDSTVFTNKDAELDKLSTLLSRQFLEDVDAETIPSSSSPTATKTKTSSSTMSTPNTRMLSSFTPTIPSPWTLDDGASFNQPWSPALSSKGPLPSPTITAKDNNHMTDNTATATVQWDRFEPYGNDSEFDPTLPFYQSENGNQTSVTRHALCTIRNKDTTSGTTTTTTTVPSNNLNNNSSSSSGSSSSSSSVGHGNQQENPNMATVALRKLSLLFPDLDEKELKQTLAALDYDVERTIEALSTTSSSIAPSSIPSVPMLSATSGLKAPATAIAESIHLMKSPVTTTMTNTSINHINNDQPMVSIGTVRKRQVCRHYLAGECYRKDCWFAHDLEIKPCKFWLQGLCLKGDTCEFAHNLEELEQVAKNHHHYQSSSPSSTNNNNKSTTMLTSHHHHHHHHHHLHQQEQPQQQQQYTSPTVADFPILVARSKRKSKKKSHNKKIKT